MMTESNYKRDIIQEFFYPLKGYQKSPGRSYFIKDEIDLAEKLAQHYNLPLDNILRLISYTEKSLEWALQMEQTFNINDLSGLFHFEARPEPIRKVSFECDNISFTITNPYLIDRLYQTAHEAMNTTLDKLKQHKDDEFSMNGMLGVYIYQNRIFNEGPKRVSGPIIKSIGTEIIRELMDVEMLSEYKSVCILGAIMSLYKVGLKANPIMTEQEHREDCAKNKIEMKMGEKVIYDSYLTYCFGIAKNWHY